MREYKRWQEFLKAIDRRLQKVRGYPTTAEEQEELSDGFYDPAHVWSSWHVKRALQFLEVPREPKKRLVLGYRGWDRPTYGLKDSAVIVREMLGLAEPLPFDKLRNWLSRFDTGGKLRLDYAVTRKDIAGASMWEVETICASEGDGRLVAIKNFVDMISDKVSWHPGLVLAFLLCEIPLYTETVEVFRSSGGLTIKVSSLDVSPKAVSKAYSLARSMVRTQPKKKTLSGRIRVLHAFIEEHSDLAWEERWKRWNREFPEWKYSSVPSMQVVYSRVNKKLRSFYDGLPQIDKASKSNKQRGGKRR